LRKCPAAKNQRMGYPFGVWDSDEIDAAVGA
jgi:hypothetical protein